LLLIRHGRAGDRARWKGDDRDRPLDRKGLRQAEWVVEALADYPIERILSSPYRRCVETVEPLATARGLTIELSEALIEGAAAEAEQLVRELSGTCAALCTHGDVIMHLTAGKPAKKGSVWVLDGKTLRPLRYLAPSV
jgi:8-oxo-(d)GTP phosphatase